MEMKILSDLPKEEYFMCGHNECPACGAALVVRLALKVLGKNTIVVLPPNAILASAVRLSSFMVPTASAPMASAAALASGIVHGRRVLGKNRATVVVFGGDASTVDMGFQALSAAAARGDDFLYICYDNESNVNTGDQASSTTPLCAVTPTTPRGKVERPKEMAMIMAEHAIPYVATASVAHLGDYVQKVQKAAAIEGPKYIHVHTVCPCAWEIPDEKMLEIGRLAVETRVFPLFEVVRGVLCLTYIPTTFLPVDPYLGAQGRFKEISALGRAKFQEWVNDRWERLYQRHGAGTTAGGITRG